MGGGLVSATRWEEEEEKMPGCSIAPFLARPPSFPSSSSTTRALATSSRRRGGLGRGRFTGWKIRCTNVPSPSPAGDSGIEDGPGPRWQRVCEKGEGAVGASPERLEAFEPALGVPPAVCGVPRRANEKSRARSRRSKAINTKGFSRRNRCDPCHQCVR